MAPFAPPQSAVHLAMRDPMQARVLAAMPYARSGLANEQLIETLMLLTSDNARIDARMRSVLEQALDQLQDIAEADRIAALDAADDEASLRTGGAVVGQYDAGTARRVGFPGGVMP
ncbi:hypothetical protein O4H66_17170 [Comamonadaceae bacterium G21597-S1]|nr:hypothetical protein [Comamonadaceae bacterium G21597-S1]